MISNEVKAPWLSCYGDVPPTLSYPEGTMWDAVEEMVKKYPKYIAYNFMGCKTTYREFASQVELCAKALRAIGIREGDRITICMPNCPQAVIMFYAVNLVGAIANMIHPLSSEREIEFYIKESGSVVALTLDQFYGKFEAIRQNVDLQQVIIARIKDEMSPQLKAGYMLTEGLKVKRIPSDAPVVFWNDFLRGGRKYHWKYRVERKKDDPAVILYSGGTTGITKGILLSNYNFNALACQILAANPIHEPGDRMLCVMPIFHGFGLGVTIHSILANGGSCILVPRFTPKSYAKMILKYRCNFIAGVPSLYEALLREPCMKKADLSCLKGVFCGGDTLTVELKRRFDKFLDEHNSRIHIREGYGTTECVTASCLTPIHLAKEGSIGQPLPDMYYKIVKVGTEEEVPYGEEGEICIAGPTVMLGYLNQPEETEKTLRRHADGLLWVHTGDLGVMDSDGFVYFRQRIKRMIITNGYNVYPSQLENILDAHEYVQVSCVIGVPDPIRMQRVKAFIVLKTGIEPTDETKEKIMAYCRKNIAKYALPREIEFRDSLPKTLVGKVAYRLLEEEELERLKSAPQQEIEEEQEEGHITGQEENKEQKKAPAVVI
jgi:long-chain acyl-CoA synthetase